MNVFGVYTKKKIINVGKIYIDGQTRIEMEPKPIGIFAFSNGSKYGININNENNTKKIYF